MAEKLSAKIIFFLKKIKRKHFFHIPLRCLIAMLKSINKGVRGGGCFTSHRRLWEGSQHSFSEGNCYAVGHGADACGDGCKR